jgi:hypothetical protein
MLGDTGARIDNLSRDLPPATAFSVYQWVYEFIHMCHNYERTLAEAGVMEFANSVLERAAEKEPVSADLLQKVQDFHKAHDKLFYGLVIEARDWVRSQFARDEVMEFSAKAKREADDNRVEGVAYMVDYREPNEKRDVSTGITHAEGAG